MLEATLDSMMTEMHTAATTPCRKYQEFDYHAAIWIVSGEVFQLLGKDAYPLIEWCVNDALIASREGCSERLSKRLGFLSIMASYFGASPIEKISHQIDVLLSNGSKPAIDNHLNDLQFEVERFLPVLRERLQTNGLNA